MWLEIFKMSRLFPKCEFGVIMAAFDRKVGSTQID